MYTSENKNDDSVNNIHGITNENGAKMIMKCFFFLFKSCLTMKRLTKKKSVLKTIYVISAYTRISAITRLEFQMCKKLKQSKHTFFFII